jgi:hypothetical protein
MRAMRANRARLRAQRAGQNQMRKQIGGGNANPCGCRSQLPLSCAHIGPALNELQWQTRLYRSG